MSYSGRTSQDDRDEDDEDEYEEVDGSNRLLGFMFGNVDDSGDLDVDYLDEDAKEHLAALADKLGSSLTDIDLSAKSPRTPADAAEQDYDGKAEDAVDYVDIDEQYEGPETQVASEEDFLLPKKEYLSAGVSVAALERAAAVFDDENYDEDEEDENEHEVVDHTCDAPSISLTVDHKKYPGTPYEGDNVQSGPSEAENFDANLTDYQEEESHVLEEPCDGECPTHLPVLYIEDGMAILRFSEIFGIHEPLKKTARRAHKYAVARDKYKYMDAMNFVEEDEEAFLKSSFQGFSLMKQTHVSQDEITSLIDDERESAEASIFSGDNAIAMSSAERRKEYCLSATPMKENIVDEVLAGWASPLSPKFYPLDQQDWEDGIIWDNSPVVGRSSSESCITSKPNSEALVNGEIETWTAGQSFLSELQIHSDEKERPSFLHNSQLLMESFGSRESSQQANLLLSKRRYHPQILRLESPVEVDDSVPCDATMQKVGEENRPDYLSRHLGKLLPQNREIVDGSWLKNVIWEPHKNLLKPKLILDLQDEQMLFEIISTKEAKHLTLHARAMIMTRNMSRSIDFLDRHSHGAPSSGRFDIANDKFYSNRKTSQQLKSLSKKRTAHGIKVLHSVPALKLQTMKLKLSNKDISNFHRPKGLWYPRGNEVVLKEQARLSTQGPMKIILKSVGGKGSKVHVDAEETVSSLKEKASKKLDFKPSEPVKILYCGKELEDFKSLAVQNVQPNSLLHLVRTKIHLLPRAQKLPGANKSLRPPGAFKKKPDLSAKDGHVFLMEYCEERPLLLGNVGMGARLCTYYQKLTPDDQTGGLLHNENSKLGSILILDPADRSPFLGDIKPGCMQSSLETNMYRAPIFPHKVPLTDYLLVRSAKGKLSIRRIDRIDAVGQQEPHMEVMSPGSKVLQTYIMNRLLVHMYREFRTAKKHELHPFIRADELSAQFPNLSEAFLRKRFKHCADLQRGPNGEFCWFMRRNFHIPLEEELRRMVTPENVCAYESMQAGLYRLKHLGIRKLTQLTHISGAMNQLPDEAIALAAASHIERELQITPWNLSSNFVACTSQDRENLERLEITGVGDPSGRGLGFSYVRAVVKAPLSSAMMKTKTVVGQRGTTVTGTDADLRRLSMEAAREVLLRFNVPEEQIAKLTRWHRIAMIRKLSSEQAASGIKVDPTTISKFARGQRMSFLQLQQQAREKCQEIWDRQVQSLSAVDGDENESDSEANSDLDSFAGDLENLLDAEEFGAGEKDHGELIHEKADGVRGLKMRRHPSQAQTEEEIEDEAAEVAELCRMLLDDDETDKKKKKKTKPVANELPLGFENAEQVKRSTTLMKKISTSQPDAFLLLKESINKDRTEVENSHIKGNVAGKARAMKKNDVALAGSFSKKVKVIGDGVKIVKEKKPSRESFICGACGQLGHMRTNKNCPKYGEDIIDAQLEAADLDRAPARSFDSSSQPQPKPLMIKKIIPKTAAKAALLESSEGEKSILKPKTLKFKCGPIDKVCSKLTLGGTAEHPAFSDAETGEKSISKVNKIRIPNIMKPDELLIGPQKPSIVVRPPMSKEKNQVSANKLSSSMGLPGERDQAEYRKPNIVIRPPMEQPPRKITIKRTKEIIDLDQFSQDGSCGPEYRKTKKIAELSNIEKHGKQESEQFSEESSRWRPRKDKRWSEEEKTRRNAERLTEEGARRNYEERRVLEQQGSFAEIAMYGESIRQEWEEEERLKARKKKRKQKPAMGEYYLEDHMSRMRGRRIPERDCSAKMKSSAELRRYGEDYGPPTKRRRAGEVGLSNILEKIIEILKDKHEISYLFLKPVTKKEAPDYLNIIARPMDLSTIREKVRRFEYKNREEFRHDVWQITVNAHRYNDGRNPCIPPLADQLLELCDYLLYENRATLDEAEVGIEFRDI